MSSEGHQASWIERASNLGAALSQKRRHDERARWSRDRILAFQQERLNELVRFATRHSPFYRHLYGDVGSGDVRLEKLPPVDKAQMMGAFDRFVTDPRLRLEPLLEHVGNVRGDQKYRERFRVMTSSGSSGLKAVYVYDDEAWRSGFIPGGLRMTSMVGISPRLPNRRRLATVAAPDGKHMTFRGGASMDVGLYATCRAPATDPPGALLAKLARSAPT